MSELSPGGRLRALLSASFVTLPGAFDAVSAMLAKHAGFEALYVSGSGTATGSYGVPDLGLVMLDEMAGTAGRIAMASGLPVLADADMGFGGPVHVERTVRVFEQAGVAGIHVEDQSFPKRCGHLDGKRLVDEGAMVRKIEAACAARRDDGFVICARSDARAVEGMEGLIRRAKAYVAAGADMIFPEAMHTQVEFKQVSEAVGVPILANMTEFGKSELLTVKQLEDAGCRAVLWPLSAFRVMLRSVLDAYRTLKADQVQTALVDRMMTRRELYDIIGYDAIEQRIREDEEA